MREHVRFSRELNHITTELIVEPVFGPGEIIFYGLPAFSVMVTGHCFQPGTGPHQPDTVFAFTGRRIVGNEIPQQFIAIEIKCDLAEWLIELFRDDFPQSAPCFLFEFEIFVISRKAVTASSRRNWTLAGRH